MCRPDGRHVLNNQGTDDYVLTMHLHNFKNMDTCNGCSISSCRYYNNQLFQYSFMEYFE